MRSGFSLTEVRMLYELAHRPALSTSILVDARRLYEKAGFQLTSEDKHHSFGKALVGQVWSRDL